MSERLLTVDAEGQHGPRLRFGGWDDCKALDDDTADKIAAELDRLYAAAEANQAPGPDWKAKLREEVADLLGGDNHIEFDVAVGSVLNLIHAMPDPPTPDPDAPPVYVPEPGHVAPVEGRNVPDGWVGRYLNGGGDFEWSAGHCRANPTTLFEVRRVPAPEPATEWVPLTKLVGRTIKGETKPVAVASSAGGEWVWCNGIDGLFAPFPTRDDGMVEVLTEGER